MTAIASCTLLDETEPFAQQMRMPTDLADYAMRIARSAVEQDEALAAPRADCAATPPRRLPCPGSIFIRAARLVQNCIIGQSRLAAGPPVGRLTLLPTSAGQAANPTPIAQKSPVEQSRAEPVRQALRTVTRNHPQGQKLLCAGLENLAAAGAANPSRAAALPDCFRHVCDQTGIRLSPAQERKAGRDLACQIRAAPA